jgi:hypothetical protein
VDGAPLEADGLTQRRDATDVGIIPFVNGMRGRGGALRFEFARAPPFLSTSAARLGVRAGSRSRRSGNIEIEVAAFVAAGQEQRRAERGCQAEGGSIHPSRFPLQRLSARPLLKRRIRTV